jgi:hypothetical protein
MKTAKTLFEKSYEEWRADTGGSRREWTATCVAEWDRIRASLVRTGHWHDGIPCALAWCL